MTTGKAQTSCAAQGDLANDKYLRQRPPDHAVGKSRGELATKIHSLVGRKLRAW
ncbi:hypothetical protein [Paeniglutamicibacter psychrophenolicus]|uniref:Uncharacterized protein n=1 Tax=Paeniglutamicibacter psychrophenolicus TaxID=257454 RepID=A0ABS4WHT4_9MICC|nr:hypothetical protein [Paeniglutamicibacter psychrophenolicus]MBP2375763.1 hypothetical protein [Paeniglutamicibacter psychrophenolicus]